VPDQTCASCGCTDAFAAGDKFCRKCGKQAKAVGCKWCIDCFRKGNVFCGQCGAPAPADAQSTEDADKKLIVVRAWYGGPHKHFGEVTGISASSPWLWKEGNEQGKSGHCHTVRRESLALCPLYFLLSA
jgi:hypothetical protein